MLRRNPEPPTPAPGSTPAQQREQRIEDSGRRLRQATNRITTATRDRSR